MRGINQFNKFDTAAFFADKRFKVIGISELKDYNTKEHIGTKVEVVIVADNTKYKPSTDGSVYSNLYEKLTFKVMREVKPPIGSLIEPINAVASIYGEYRNMLSVKCSDIKVLSQPKE